MAYPMSPPTYPHPPFQQVAPQVPGVYNPYTNPYRQANHAPASQQSPQQQQCSGLLHTDPWCEQGASCALQEDDSHRRYFWHPCKLGKDCPKTTDALHQGYFQHFVSPFEDLLRARYCLQGQSTTASLLATSHEYQWLATLVNTKGGLNGLRIVSISRVHNAYLFEMFLSHVTSLQASGTTALKTLDNTHAHVKWLFHTPSQPAHVDVVATHGLHSQFGSPLGDGIYFTSTTTSPLFRPVNGTNNTAQSKYFVVSLVLVGSSTIGSAGLRRPPSGCHSAVDNTANPSTYVSFLKEHSYPAYIVQIQ